MVAAATVKSDPPDATSDIAARAPEIPPPRARAKYGDLVYTSQDNLARARY